MKKQFIFYLITSSLYCFGMQIEDNIFEYDKALRKCQECLEKSEDKSIYQQRVFALLQDRSFIPQDIISLRKILLNTFLKGPDLEKKLITALESDLIYNYDLWLEIENAIKTYCANPNAQNAQYVDILKLYTQAISRQRVAGRPILVDYSAALTALSDAISTAWSHKNMCHKDSQSSYQNQETQTTQVVDAVQELAISPAISTGSSSQRKLTKHERARAKAVRRMQEQQIKTEPATSCPTAQPIQNIAPESSCKSRDMLKLDYINQQKNNIENYEKFFSCAKETYESETTREETVKILKELKCDQENFTLLLYLAKFEIECDKNIDMFVVLSERAIQAQDTNLISKILDTNIYSELIKWVNNAELKDVNAYEEKLISYITPTSFQMLDSLAEQRKWLTSCIKLLRALTQKTHSKNAAIMLIDLVTLFGYDTILDNFVIKPEELISCLKEYYDSHDYHELIERLLQKNKKTPTKLAIEYCGYCAEKFNNISCMHKMLDVIVCDYSEESFEQYAYWARKIIKLDPSDDLAKYKLARMLYKKQDSSPTDLDEITDLLENNKLKKARFFRMVLSCDRRAYSFIKADPDELTDFIEEIIVNPECDYTCAYEISKDILIKELIQNLSILSQEAIRRNPTILQEALDKYNNSSELPDKEKLEEIILGHPLFNKMEKWPSRFKRIMDAVKSTTNLNLDEYFQQLGESCDSMAWYIMTNSEYDLELKRGVTEHLHDKSGSTILHYLVGLCLPDLTQFVIKIYPELVNIKSKFNETAVLFAIPKEAYELKEYIRIIDMLRAVNPAIIHEPNNEKVLPIHLAASLGIDKIFEHLIENCDADPFIENGKGLDCLELAVKNDKSKIVDYLIAKKYDKIDLQNFVWGTIQYNRPELLKKALDLLTFDDTHHCDIAFSCIHITIKNGLFDLLKIIVGPERDFINIIAKTQRKKTKELVRLLIIIAEQSLQQEPEEKSLGIKQIIKYLKEVNKK